MLFDRPICAFKQLKETIQQIRSNKSRKNIKNTGKMERDSAPDSCTLPDMYGMSKPKIESWTNGWNLRSHFGRVPKRISSRRECLSSSFVESKQYQIYLMYQHYKSEERYGSIAAYNQLLAILKEWSKTVDIKDYYIWPTRT